MMIKGKQYDKQTHHGMLRKLISTGAVFQYVKMTLVAVAKDLLLFVYPKALIK